MGITSRSFGRTKEGQEALLYTLNNKNGLSVEITNYGGIITSLLTPDKNGEFTDITLGFDNLEGYLEEHPYFGALIGRHANRIEDSQFELNGVKYDLYKNNGKNHLHGGLKGFDKVVWDSKVINKDGGEALRLKYRSKDGEEGYPGNLDVEVTYALTDKNELVIEYTAVSDKDTVVNLTNHAYFNLSGHAAGLVAEHKVMINADKFTVINEECLPNGEIMDVSGTPMDLREPKPLALAFDNDYEQIKNGGGFDHNWILNSKGDITKLAAKVYDEASGRVMEVYTSKPGIQLYTANFLDGTLTGKEGAVYHKRNALCLETQFYPNGMKHKHFPSPILKGGQLYQYATIYKFGVE